jgi:hypothetical protein
MEGEISREAILAELKHHQESPKYKNNAILVESKHHRQAPKYTNNIVFFYDEDDYSSHLEKVTKFKGVAKGLLKDLIRALEFERKCNGNGRYLDCTCPKELIFTKETTCEPCRDRVFNRLAKGPNFLFFGPIIIRSEVAGPAICACNYCLFSTKSCWKKLRKIIPTLRLAPDCCDTETFNDKCTPCLLVFTADLISRRKL